MIINCQVESYKIKKPAFATQPVVTVENNSLGRNVNVPQKSHTTTRGPDSSPYTFGLSVKNVGVAKQTLPLSEEKAKGKGGVVFGCGNEGSSGSNENTASLTPWLSPQVLPKMHPSLGEYSAPLNSHTSDLDFWPGS